MPFRLASVRSSLTFTAGALPRASLISTPLILLASTLVAALAAVLYGTTASESASAAQLNRPHAQSLADPLVFALYYPWFDENTWTYDKLSDLPAQTYVSRDRSAMGRHIDQAKAAGIDAFLVAWYGPGENNQTESNLAALLEEASARSFRIGVLVETDSPFFGSAEDVSAALSHLISVHAAHPFYLRVDGRPVVFFWRPTVYSVDTWRSIRGGADPSYTNIWISEGVDTSYLQVFDGHYLYSNTWNPPANLEATNLKFANLVASASQDTGKAKHWVATVMPGYDDTRIRASGFAQDRAGGAYFTQSWQAAIASQPLWIVINSFNEWPEGTYIEPSVAYGEQYIGLAASWSSTFKGGPRPEVLAASVPAASEAPVPTPAVQQAAPAPVVDTPTAFVNVALLNLRAGPGTDYEILGQVAQGTRLPITGSAPAVPDWWQVQFEADLGGQSGPAPAWVYAPLVNTAGPLDQVTVLSEAAVPIAPYKAGTALTGPGSAHTSILGTFLLKTQSRPLTPYPSP